MTAQRCPAEIGMPLDVVDTPALLVDLDAFDHNLQHMAAAVAAAGVRLRPHAKTHKSPVIALRQMALGAVGVCCQKVGEAEAMVHGGVGDVLLSNEIVGPSKVARLAALARQARIAVCADDPHNVAEYGEAARAFGVELTVLVELNVGADRCGLEPGEPVLRLARRIADTQGLRFAGLQAYHGSAQHLRTPEERRTAIQFALERIVATRTLLERNGIPCPTVTGAGTGTYSLEASSGIYNELQAGSYVFMDADYAKNLDHEGRPVSEFRHSLFVYATVMSRPTADRAMVDAGIKALAVDSGMPRVAGVKGVEYVRASDEHGKLRLQEPDPDLHVGDKLKLIPGHCDPTVNLYDWYVGIRNDRVEALWPIAARGALY
ncbi:MAG: DSD1 family PLP-dependent enzyme [Desulfobacterales bacterium]|nr:DSD1 family PLP-dependent enzyme [Desulfobacterales bacterium]